MSPSEAEAISVRAERCSPRRRLRGEGVVQQGRSILTAVDLEVEGIRMNSINDLLPVRGSGLELFRQARIHSAGARTRRGGMELALEPVVPHAPGTTLGLPAELLEVDE